MNEFARKTATFLFLLSIVCMRVDAQSLEGIVVDAGGGRVAGARVELWTAGGTHLSSVTTDAAGNFSWPALVTGNYQLRIEAAGFAPRQVAVNAGASFSRSLQISLEPQSLTTQVTVSANRGVVEDASASSYLATVVERAEMISRPAATLGNVLEQKPGVLVQQSTYAQVSPFLRGFTGYHVLNLIDGLRFTNSTFRSGPNQYLAFVEPGQAERIELLLGPTGAQYGSDSLGGTVSVITPSPKFIDEGAWESHGDLVVHGASADASAGAAASVSASGERWSWLAGASGRRHGDLRAGSGDDSRNVFRRLFGLSPSQAGDFLGKRQQDTGFSQYGLHSKLLARLPSNQILSLWAQRNGQDNVHGYKDLLGGLGRLQSTFDPQQLTFLYARYEKLRAGPLDSVNATFSFNSQTDGSIRQGLNAIDPITRDRNRVDVYGWSAQATRQWTTRLLTVFGGDIYDEHIRSSRLIETPNRREVAEARPLYPDRSAHQTYGMFGQAALELPHRVRAAIGVRGTAVRFRTAEQQAFGIPKSSQWFRDLTFSSSVSWQVTDFFGVQGLISRGFRAPNLNDLGAIGLNDLGYEIPAAEAIPAGALLSTDAGDGALSKQRPVDPLRPESLMNYEFGIRFTARRMYARVQAFDAELHDPIVRRTLLFPIANVPSQLAGLAVTSVPQTASQRDQGVAAVSSALDPRAVKAFVNDGRSRYYGFESLIEYKLSSSLSLEANYSFLAGRELDPNRSIRRLPPQSGSATVRWFPGRRWWVDLSASASGAQERLSGGDIDDERIGASRRRRDIADFFQGGRAQPLIDPATGEFGPTGETLRQIQDRVLPLGSIINGIRIADDNTRVPLYLKTAGWAAFHIRAGVPMGERSHLLLAIENLLDRNYRVHGSGVDAPGVNAYAAFRYTF